jgi:hypothetical protein
MSMTFAEKVFDFYSSLTPPLNLPTGVEVMNPYTDLQTKNYLQQFLTKYYSDDNNRVLILGINPGRFGAGITGVAFTDPVALTQYCKIKNHLPQKRELSSEFVYQFIDSWGGVEEFYRDFFLTAISPLGFVKNGKNYNYYDDMPLLKATLPFITDSLEKQMKIAGHTKSVIIFGIGENQKHFDQLNQQKMFFDKVYAVEHPRFIMQYKRRFIKDYIKKYHEVFLLAKTG